MKTNKWMSLILGLTLVLSLTGCSSGPAVYVQSVEQLMGYGGIGAGDRFGGMVVSEFVAEVEKDADKTVAELLVAEGDDVKEGDPLFSYDTEELQLNLDKQKLELEQMQSSIESYEKQIKQLERERDRVGGTDKLQFTVQIQTTQLDLKETQLKIKTKEAEVKKSEKLLANAEVTSPVTGRVQAINESGTSPNGEPAPYITIQKSGAYRVKGVMGELQRGSIMEGSKLKITSRTDPDQFWTGTVSLVDFENPIKDQNRGMMMENGDEMSRASKYPFYVKLDSTEGLMMGQHVYLELDSGENHSFDVAVDGSFLVMEGENQAYVWAENSRGKLEKRKITLGEFNENLNFYEVLEGLSKEDFIAFPDENLCKEGASTTHELVLEDMEEDGMMPDAGILPDGPMMPEEGMEMLPEEGVEVLPEEGVEVLPEEDMEATAEPLPEDSPEAAGVGTEAANGVTEGGE